MNRFGNVAVHSRGQTTLPIAGHRVGRQGNNRNVLACAFLDFAHSGGGLESPHDRHLYIHQDQVELRCLEFLQRLAPVAGNLHMCPRFSSRRTASIWFTRLSSARRM